MQPGGCSAWPEAFETVGCGERVVHGGFYAFDEGRDDPERARRAGRKEMAKAYFDVGLHTEAEEGFLLVIEDRPRNSMAWLHLGQIRMNRGDLAGAREAFADCIDGDGGSLGPVLFAVSHLLRGNTYDLEERREEAVAEYEAVLASGVDFQGVDAAARGYLDTPFTPDD